MKASTPILFTFTALALAPALALPLDPAGDGEWADLDREVEALTSSLLHEGGGPGLFGRVRSAYRASSDGTPDLSAVGVADARLGVAGSHSGYSYRLEVDFADDWGEGTLGLLDAQASFSVIDGVMATIGRFRPVISSDGLLDSGSMVFLERSSIGTAFAARDEGLMLQGTLSSLDWALSAMNGLDDQGDDALLSARASWEFTASNESSPGNASGNGPVEGAHGVGGQLRARVSASLVDDRSLADSDCTLMEFRAGAGNWSLAVDTVDVGSAGFTSLASGAFGFLAPDTNPHSVSGTYLLSDDWEMGLRVQDLDQGNLVQRDLALTHYISGHDLKWTLGLSQTENEATGSRTELWGFALNVGF